MSNKIIVNPVVAQTNMNHSVVISKVNLVGGNTKDWWVDTRATRHVCSEKKMFSTYNQWVMEEKFSWEIHQPLRLKELERLCSK